MPGRSKLLTSRIPGLIRGAEIIIAVGTTIREVPSFWPRFVICVDNSRYEVSLEIGKVYRNLKAHARDIDGWLRVIDNSGEDYLFPAKRFVEVSIHPAFKKALTKAASYSNVM